MLWMMLKFSESGIGSIGVLVNLHRFESSFVNTNALSAGNEHLATGWHPMSNSPRKLKKNIMGFSPKPPQRHENAVLDKLLVFSHFSIVAVTPPAIDI